MLKPLSKLHKKFKHISLDLSALPAELHYLFALSLTQAAYAFDEFKSKKADNVLEQISLISAQSPLNAAQLKLIEAVQSGQSFARDLGNRPGNICFPEYLAEQALELAAQYPDLPVLMSLMSSKWLIWACIPSLR